MTVTVETVKMSPLNFNNQYLSILTCVPVCGMCSSTRQKQGLPLSRRGRPTSTAENEHPARRLQVHNSKLHVLRWHRLGTHRLSECMCANCRKACACRPILYSWCGVQMPTLNEASKLWDAYRFLFFVRIEQKRGIYYEKRNL